MPIVLSAALVGLIAAVPTVVLEVLLLLAVGEAGPSAESLIIALSTRALGFGIVWLLAVRE